MSEELRDPGRLDRFVVLETPDDDPDGAGGAVRSWTPVISFWAALRPIALRDGIANGSLEQRVTHELTYRAGPGLTTAQRVRFGERLFRIEAVRDLTEDGTRKLALVEEIGA